MLVGLHVISTVRSLILRAGREKEENGGIGEVSAGMNVLHITGANNVLEDFFTKTISAVQIN